MFDLLPESWVQVFIFPGQLAQIMRKKNKIFLILGGGRPGFHEDAAPSGCLFLQVPRYSFLNHIYLFFTVNNNFVLKSNLAAVGVFICSRFIFQVKAFLLKIQLSRLLIVGMTVTLLCGFCFSFWHHIDKTFSAIESCNWCDLFVSSENSQAWESVLLGGRGAAGARPEGDAARAPAARVLFKSWGLPVGKRDRPSRARDAFLTGSSA